MRRPAHDAAPAPAGAFWPAAAGLAAALAVVGHLVSPTSAASPPLASAAASGTAAEIAKSTTTPEVFPASSPTRSSLSVADRLRELRERVDELEPSRFTSGRKTLFAGRLATAIHRLERGHELAAASQLRSLLRTTDGCSALGRPDRNDWVVDCEMQEKLHQALSAARRDLERSLPGNP